MPPGTDVMKFKRMMALNVVSGKDLHDRFTQRELFGRKVIRRGHKQIEMSQESPTINGASIACF